MKVGGARIWFSERVSTEGPVFLFFGVGVEDDLGMWRWSSGCQKEEHGGTWSLGGPMPMRSWGVKKEG